MPSTRRQKAQKDEGVLRKTNYEDDDTATPVKEQFNLDGVAYPTYQDFVDAKRARNQKQLLHIGLIQAVDDVRGAVFAKKASQRGIARKRKSGPNIPLTRRKSNRIAGVRADGQYVEHERSGTFVISGGATGPVSSMTEEANSAEPEYFNNRINDGSDLTLKQAVELSESKWIDEGSADRSLTFATENFTIVKNRTAKSPTSVAAAPNMYESKMEQLAVDDPGLVAKVTPDRIYCVSCHPSTDALIVCAGDKQGYVGMWNVDDPSADHDGVHLFHVHTRPVSCLSWTPSGNALLSASYDGSVRWFDAESQTFSQIFATFDESLVYRNELGRGLDCGYNDWVQYVTPDHRNASDQCFFLSTSLGMAIHADLRVGHGKLTFHEQLSERKINSLCLHPNGHTLASAGLDGAVRLWDIRMFADDRRGTHSSPKAIATQHAGKSVNSAFFSPSGSRLLSTTMANYLDVTNDPHRAKDSFKPTRRVRHDNHTGRWLSTFMAQWHPQSDIFVCGSMQRPRAMEVFDENGNKIRTIQGDSLTAVASRCCFHPSQEKLVIVGGNSSGRVTVAR